MSNQPLIIDDKYEVLTLIGEGGMSRVYLARDKRLNKQWAIKEIKTTGDRVKDEVIAASFIKEANMMKQLDHPLLPRIVDIVNQNNTAYVIMDYIEGQSLSKILREHGPQPQESVIEWGLDLCEALDYLHTRNPPIIYRDMKPANIMLRPDGTVRIVDFGTAREYNEINAGKRIDDTTVLGTRGYAAPEQFGGLGQTDPRTDVYCLGATLHHLLTGQSPAEPPYEILPLRQINPAFSPGLEKVIAKCVQQNPAARYQNCAELYYALENYEKEDDEYFKKQKRKLALFISTASLTVLMLIGGAAGLIGDMIVTRNNYDGLLESVSYADINDREQFYIDAIDLIPNQTNAYLKLIAHYEEDGVLDSDEYSTFSTIINNNRDRLITQRDYPTLAYEVGRLYWYYYEEQDTYGRSLLARDWYSDALSSSDAALQKSAQIHYGMTSLIVDLSKGRPEGMTSGTYVGYYQNLTELVNLLKDESNSVIKLRGSTVVLVTIQKDVRYLKVDGVTEVEVTALFNDSVMLLESTEFDQKVMSELYQQKQNMLEQQDSIQEAIDDAYRL